MEQNSSPRSRKTPQGIRADYTGQKAPRATENNRRFRRSRVASILIQPPMPDTPNTYGRTLTILNLKGGVGKTHTTWLLASVCQERAKRVLLIDTDTQGNLSNSFVDPVDTGRGVDLLLHPGSDHNPLPLIRRTAFSHIDVIPSSAVVARFDLSNQADWEKSDQHRCFVDPIRVLAEQYDYILFDCPPRLSLVSFAEIGRAHV